MIVNNDNLFVVIYCIAYNQEAYIRKCLEGFVMQNTNFHFVAVVHDDASSDRTADIIKEYAEKYPDIIIPILEKENQWKKHDCSLDRIMDETISKLNPKYIAMCEGDDYWIDPEKLQLQVDFMEANKDYVLCHTARVENVKGKEISPKWQPQIPPNNDYSYFLLDEGNVLITPTVLYSYSAYKHIERAWIGQNFMMGDFPLWIELSRMGKFKYFPQITSCYRILAESASHSKNICYHFLFLKSYTDVMLFYAKKYNLRELVEKKNKQINKYDVLIALCNFDIKEVLSGLKNMSRITKGEMFNVIKYWIICLKKKYHG